MYELPTQVVGPVSRFHEFPRLSPTPVMLTGKPFHGVLVETNATKVVAPAELKEAVVWAVSGVPLMYPRLLTSTGGWPCTPVLMLQVKLAAELWLPAASCALTENVWLPVTNPE